MQQQNPRARRDLLLVSSSMQQPGSGGTPMPASGAPMPDYNRHQFSFKATDAGQAGGIYGPVRFDKLRSLWRKGMVRDTTMLWVSGREHQGGTVATYAGLIDALNTMDDDVKFNPKQEERLAASASAAEAGHKEKKSHNGGGSDGSESNGGVRLGRNRISDPATAHVCTGTNGKTGRDPEEEIARKRKSKIGTTVMNVPNGNDRSKHGHGTAQSPVDTMSPSTAQRVPDLSDDNEKKRTARQLAVVMKKMLMWSINNGGGNGVGASTPGGAEPPKVPPEIAALLTSATSSTGRASTGTASVDIPHAQMVRPPMQHDKDATEASDGGGPQHTRASSLGRRESKMREIRRRRSSVMPSLRKAVQEKEMSRALHVDIDTLEKEADVMEVQVNSMPSTPVFRAHAKTATSNVADSPNTMRSPSDKKVTDELVRLLALKQEMKTAPTSAIRKQLLLRAVSNLASPTSSSQSLAASSSHSIGPFGIARSQYGGNTEATLKALEVRIMVLGEMLQSSCDLLRNDGTSGRHAAEVQALSEQYSGLSERFENYKRQNSLLSEENSLVHDEIARLRANMSALSPLMTVDAANSREQPRSATSRPSSSPPLTRDQMTTPPSSSPPHARESDRSVAAHLPTSTLRELQKAAGMAADTSSQNQGDSGNASSASPSSSVPGSSDAPMSLRALIQGQKNVSDVGPSPTNLRRRTGGGDKKAVRWTSALENAEGGGERKSVSAKDTRTILRSHTPGTSSSNGGIDGNATKSTSKSPLAVSSTVAFYPYRHSRTNYRKLIGK